MLTTWKFRIKDIASAGRELTAMGKAVNVVWNHAKETQIVALQRSSTKGITKSGGTTKIVPNYFTGYDRHRSWSDHHGHSFDRHYIWMKRMTKLPARIAHATADYPQKASTKVVEAHKNIFIGNVLCHLMNRSRNMAGVSLDDGLGAFKTKVSFRAT